MSVNVFKDLTNQPLLEDIKGLETEENIRALINQAVNESLLSCVIDELKALNAKMDLLVGIDEGDLSE